MNRAPGSQNIQFVSKRRSAIRRKNRADQENRSPTAMPATHPRPVSETYSVIRSDRLNDRQQEPMQSSSVTTGAPAPKEIHQMSRNGSTMAADSPVALHPATLRASLTLGVIAAFAAFAVRAAGLTFGF